MGSPPRSLMLARGATKSGEERFQKFCKRIGAIIGGEMVGQKKLESKIFLAVSLHHDVPRWFHSGKLRESQELIAVHTSPDH
ncbi:hypothetical protein Tco_0967381 [Tanacetum coccineum]